MHNENILLRTDVYKIGHEAQYPPGTTKIYSTLVARSGKVFNASVVFGWSYFIKRYLVDGIKPGNAAHFQTYADAILGPGVVKPEAFQALEKLGYWPLEIKALPEGSLVETGNVLATFESTNPDFPWVGGFLEGLLLKVWNPMTVATNSLRLRKVLEIFADRTVGNRDHVAYQIHDFGYRGCSSEETAEIGGGAHLLSFRGSDTVPAIVLLDTYYNASGTTPLNEIGNSVPASEHSVVTAFGRVNELAAFEHMLDLYPEGIVSMVSDSYDFWQVLTDFAVRLKPRIMARNGRTVFRPDCYDSETEILTSSGWVKFPELLEGVGVAQYRDGAIEFVDPTRYYKEPYTGEMIHFTNGKGTIDLLVTPNHRMVSRNRVTKKLRITEASEVSYHYDSTFVSAGLGVGSKKGLSYKQRLLIAFQADGSYMSSQKPDEWVEGQRFSIRFDFTKARKWERLLAICEAGGFEHKLYNEPARPQNRQITVWLDKPVPKDFSWVPTPEAIGGLWAQEFIEELSYWDATRRSHTRFKYDTTVGINAEVVQLVATLAGYRTAYSITSDERSEKFSDVHCVHIITRDYYGGQGISAKRVAYEGTVHCVTVPSGMLVVRRNKCVAVSGNSGVPELILLGDPAAPAGSPAHKGALELLWDVFGGTTNALGYRVLDQHVGIIYGDGIYYERLIRILVGMERQGFATVNPFGVGGLLLQQFSRDQLGFAIKATYVEVNGESREIYKDPVTDHAKRSFKGRVLVTKNPVDGTYSTRDQVSMIEAEGGELKTIFYNGKEGYRRDLDQIRTRLSSESVPVGFAPNLSELYHIADAPVRRYGEAAPAPDLLTQALAASAADQQALLAALQAQGIVLDEPDAEPEVELAVELALDPAPVATPVQKVPAGVATKKKLTV